MRVWILTFFFFLIFILSCKENSPIQEEIVESIFSPDTSTNNFAFNKIDLSTLIGTWQLSNAKFKCDNGIVEKLNDYFGIQDTDKIMKISENEIDLYLFWKEGYYSTGVFLPVTLDTLNYLSMAPTGGAPFMVVKIDYTDQLLTFIYPSIIKSNVTGKYYEGQTIAEYYK